MLKNEFYPVKIGPNSETGLKNQPGTSMRGRAAWTRFDCSRSVDDALYYSEIDTVVSYAFFLGEEQNGT